MIDKVWKCLLESQNLLEQQACLRDDDFIRVFLS